MFAEPLSIESEEACVEEDKTVVQKQINDKVVQSFKSMDTEHRRRKHTGGG